MFDPLLGGKALAMDNGRFRMLMGGVEDGPRKVGIEARGSEIRIRVSSIIRPRDRRR